MHFSIIAIAGLLSLAASTPTPTDTVKTCQAICIPKEPTCGSGTYPDFQDPCWTCCSDMPAPQPPRETCLAICYPQETKCSGSSYPVYKGNCWTCCSKEGSG